MGCLLFERVCNDEEEIFERGNDIRKSKCSSYFAKLKNNRTKILFKFTYIIYTNFKIKSCVYIIIIAFFILEVLCGSLFTL